MKPEVIRQRGLGALALLVLGGVVWLLLFGPHPEPAVDRRTQIPPAPELAPFEVEEPQPPAHVEPVDTPLLESGSTVSAPVEPPPAGSPEPSAAGDDQPVPSAAEPAVQPEPGLDRRGLPEAWVVQVASFGNADNAMLLRDRLREQGFKAYTESVSTGSGGRSTRVLVGPKLSRGQAEQDKAAIDKAFGLDSLVSRFDPNGGR